jgi:hypothetical protein
MRQVRSRGKNWHALASSGRRSSLLSAQTMVTSPCRITSQESFNQVGNGTQIDRSQLSAAPERTNELAATRALPEITAPRGSTRKSSRLFFLLRPHHCHSLSPPVEFRLVRPPENTSGHELNLTGDRKGGERGGVYVGTSATAMSID